MTKYEAAVVTCYTGILLGEFSDAHKLAEEIMGRPVYTHEFAFKDFTQSLKAASKERFVNLVTE